MPFVVLSPAISCRCFPVSKSLSLLYYIFVAAHDETDSDSDAYCDPESIPAMTNKSIVPMAPQKSLPAPPAEDSEASSSDDDYQDPAEELSVPRHLSLRRGSQPVFNPDAYLALEDIDMDSMYQDVSILTCEDFSKTRRNLFIKVKEISSSNVNVHTL